MFSRLSFPICIFLFMMSGAIGKSQASESFVWLDDSDYEPFIYNGEDNRPKGLFIEVISEIFNRLDKPLTIQLYPWKRTQSLVKSKKGDAMLTIATPERLSYLSASDPVFTFTWRLFANKKNPNKNILLKARTAADLRDFRLLSYLGNGWAEENLKNLKVTYAPKFTQALIMLVQRGSSFDGMIEHDFILKYNINRLIKEGKLNQEHSEILEEGTYPFDEVEFRFLIRKDSSYADILPAFNAALSEMREDGTYHRIYNKYLQ
ncbi:substrate-binding periplasmic protein [Kiloniella litopenaei]|uniref:substrate-binding periplasmic protein n=1 Tax=Kiloniella litopenaei TaxID=1549748 RepID=UPI003BAA70D8